MTNYELEARARAIGDRVYVGRRELLKVAIRPDRIDPEIVIVVGPENWFTLVDYANEITERYPAYWESADEGIRRQMRMFGLRVEPDFNFEDHEIRFRSEVRL